MKHSMQRASSLLFATLALSLSLQIMAPVWALDVQQAVDQQQLAPVYEWVQSATPAELRNLRVSWLQTLSYEMPDAENGILQTESRFGGSLLHWAAHTGQNRLITLLLDKGLEPDFPSAAMGAPLMVAARSGQLDSVRLLVARGAEPDQWNGKYDSPPVSSPLRMAIQEGHVEVARWLASQKSVQPVCEQAQGLFTASVMRERLEMVHYLQEQGCGLQDRSEDGFTPLMVAAGRGHVPLFQMLLAQGHDPRVQAPDGTTALMLAARGGQADIVATLLAAGLNVNAVNEEGKDALQYALAYGHLPIVQTLLERGASLKAKKPQGQAYLLAALHGGNLDVLHFVLSQGFSATDLSIEQYQEALLNAILKNHLAMLKYLLAQGVSLNFEDKEGRTPLRFASLMGRPEAVKVLLAAGSDPNDLGGRRESPATTGGGFSPLMDALETEQGAEIVRILLAAGADPKLKSPSGFTALIFACHRILKLGAVRLDIVQQLLAQGAQPDEANDDGTSALMYAAEAGDLEVVKFLLLKGANVNRRNKTGQTVLSYALSHKWHVPVVTFLLDQGARAQDLLPEHQFELLRLLAATGDLTRVRSLLAQLPAIGQQPDALFEIASGFAEQGHLEGVQFFLQRGVSVQASNEQDASLLSAAAASGRVELAQFLLSQGAWGQAKEDVRRRAAMTAAEHGHADMLALLLAQERQAAKQRPYQALALSQAAGAGQAQLVKKLLEQGAEPDFTKLSPPLDARSPLLAAVEGGYVAATQALLAHRFPPEELALALRKAVQAGNLPLVQALLDHGAPVDHEDEVGTPFVVFLVQEGYLDVLKRIPRQKWPLVLPEGVDFPDGTDLLMQAAKRNHLQMVTYLLEQGLTPTARTHDGQSALMLTESVDVMRLLVAKGAEVNLRKADGGTALMRAAANTHLDGVKALLEMGAEVNARKQDGTTALIWAVRRQEPWEENPHSMAASIYEVVEALLAQGADPKLRDKAGKTALDYARSNRLPEVVARLQRL
ncbi:MAG: ankyrin repeat domain-containing protein [Candidatus Sericytochromatia bacterium]